MSIIWQPVWRRDSVNFVRRYNYETNLIGSVNLINESVLHDVRCFVFASSIAVYGANQTPMTEELTPQSKDPYGVSTNAVELDLAVARHMFGLPYVIVRLAQCLWRAAKYRG